MLDQADRAASRVAAVLEGELFISLNLLFVSDSRHSTTYGTREEVGYAGRYDTRAHCHAFCKPHYVAIQALNQDANLDADLETRTSRVQSEA